MTQTSPEQHLRDGDPAAALAELQQLVRSEPAAANHRIFLFQLLAVLGSWERCKTQLAVIRDLDHGAIPMVQMYREALRCEVLREEVFAGKRSPLVFGEPEPWVAHMVQALALSADGQAEQAQAMRGAALEEAAAVPGTLAVAVAGSEDDAEHAFEWLADADSRLGPIFEVMMNGKYYWVPASAVASVEFEAPVDLRDLVWLPATFRWQNGGDAVALVPTRYVGSAAASDGAVQLARRTDWRDAGHDEYHGSGQRVFATDAAEFGLCDLRRITFAGSSGDGSSGDGPSEDGQ
ncbi:MAG: virulence protein SciE type [bacterium]|nr:virulence protein SciE type [bacterium]